MGRYATREEEIDRLLRGKRFVDLYSVVRNGLRASVESYSIKKLEALYGFSPRQSASPKRTWRLPRFRPGWSWAISSCIGATERSLVAGYNRDDCLSTAALRDWLEAQRASLDRTRDADRPSDRAGGRSERGRQRVAGAISTRSSRG